MQHISDLELLQELSERVLNITKKHIPKNITKKHIPKQDDLYFPEIYTDKHMNILIDFVEWN